MRTALRGRSLFLKSIPKVPLSRSACESAHAAHAITRTNARTNAELLPSAWRALANRLTAHIRYNHRMNDLTISGVFSVQAPSSALYHSRTEIVKLFGEMARDGCTVSAEVGDEKFL